MYWRILITTLAGSLTTVASQISNVCQIQPPIQFQLNVLELEGSVLNGYMMKNNGSSANADSAFANSSFLHAVQSIHLNKIIINKVEDSAFSQFICLSDLNLSYNLIVNITSKTFDNLTELKTLNLTMNKISLIADNAFSNLKLLKTLDLSFNNISKLTSLVFAQNTKLEYLNLSYNSFKALGDFFSSLIRLKELYIDHCGIAIFFTSWVKNSKALEKLDVSGNEVIILNFTLHSFNKSAMRLLNLSNNCLSKIEFHLLAIEFSNSNSVIDLNTNHFDCNSWPEHLSDFKKHNVSLASLRNDMGKRKVKGWSCFNESNVVVSSLIVLSVIIVSMFIVLLAVDYRANLGYRQRIINKIRKCFSGQLPPRESSYANLQADF